ncbi:hypothetical protein vBAcoSR7M_66 [Alteromonas phage vB_AcoS-R7M]|uniref:Helix-turn-helix domain-containing protein n=1 Tax=Alteromonas phage vB_AcoS-R7M TaxID=2729541 RepID=A0A6M3YP87_9CAUD|nr:hypothetical protein HWD34_gp66 [Alteromonas phage vB_AcoS-R7M]QJI53388.1 hypothetical protein vBAcoSR7M_66 [Alteromonas phage vB_AcoS-R7M]
MSKTAQQRFDETYITGYEIQTIMDVNRSTVLNARKRGILPQPIQVPGSRSFIWERTIVQPYIDAWKVALASRRRELTGGV